jgi:hypothetical protein
MTDRKQINFTIVPEEAGNEPRLSEKEIREAEADHVVRAPIRARLVLPVQFVPTLIAALQENMRIFSESHAQQPPPAPVVPPSGKGPVH